MDSVGVFAGTVKWRKWPFAIDLEPFTKLMILNPTASFKYPPTPRFLVVGGGRDWKEVVYVESPVGIVRVLAWNKDDEAQGTIFLLKREAPSRLARYFIYQFFQNVECVQASSLTAGLGP
jgi:hypothetical protein